MTISKDDFDNILRNTGLGDATSAKIFFLGVDDGYGVTEPDDLDYYLQSPTSDEGEVENNLTTAGISKIISRLRNPSGGDDWKRYRDEHLFRKDGDAVLTYMFPIGRGSQEEWPIKFERDFGLTSNGYYDFVLRDPFERFKEIDSLRAKTKLLIFFGMGDATKNYWKVFVSHYGLESERFMGIGDDIRVYSKQHIIMLPKLSNQLLDEAGVDRMAGLINDNSLNPFI